MLLEAFFQIQFGIKNIFSKICKNQKSKFWKNQKKLLNYKVIHTFLESSDQTGITT